MTSGRTGFFSNLGAIAGLCAALTVVACAPTTPKCSDETTVDLVKQILTESLEEAVLSRTKSKGSADKLSAAITFDLSAIRMTGVDDKIGKLSCEANAEVRVPPASRWQKALRSESFKSELAIMSRYVKSGGAVKLAADGALVASIRFTSQLTDDKQEVFVQVTDHGTLIAATLRYGQLAGFVPNRTPSD